MVKVKVFILFTSIFVFQMVYGNETKNDFTYESLVELIQTNKLQSVESVIPRLPLAMRSSFTLVHDSFSLQKSNAMFPRAILFGKDAKLTCTFGGHEKLEGFDTLECFQFRDATNTFDFREIEFPSKDNNLTAPIFSKPNSRARGEMKCTACHGADPRPNWENYFTWPGVYGTVDDSFAVINSRVTPTQEKNLAQLREAFLNFKKNYQESPRYKNLIFAESDFSPYSAERGPLDLTKQPNTHLTLEVSKLTALRNTRLLRQLPLLEQYKFLGAMGECINLSEAQMLAPHFSTFEWTPAFRDLDPKCKDCNHFRVIKYEYLNGLSYLNFIVAAHLIQQLVKDGELTQNFEDEVVVDASFPSYYPTSIKYSNFLKEIVHPKVIDQQKLKLSCDVIEKKIDFYQKLTGKE